MACPCAAGGSSCACCIAFTGCCAGTSIPVTLHATITGSGGCDGSYELTWVGDPVCRWQTSASIGTCPLPGKSSLAVECSVVLGCNLFALFVNDSLIAGSVTTVSCNTLTLESDNVAELQTECGCANATGTVIITL